MDNDHVRKTIQEMVEQIATLERQIAKKRSTVNDLCEHIGEPPMFAEMAASGAAINYGVQSDLYYKKPLATSARDVLQRRKAAGLGAMHLDDLYALMVKGGFKFDAKNDATAKRSLSTALSKNSIFTRLPNDDIGLTEWYDPPRNKAKANGGKPAPLTSLVGAGEGDADEDYPNDFAGEESEGVENGQDDIPAKK
jgi:hypothetical protein